MGLLRKISLILSLCGIASHAFAQPSGLSASSWLWTDEDNAPVFSATDIRIRQKDPTASSLIYREHLLYNGDDFVMEASIAPMGQGLSYQWGLAWSANKSGSDGYRFLLRADGQYAVIAIKDGKTSYLIDWTKSRKAKIQSEAMHLRMEKRGWKIYFFIDGKELDQISAPTLSGKYHGICLVGAGEIQVSGVQISGGEHPLLLASGRFPFASRRHIDSTINRPHTDETAPRLGPDKHSLYFTRGEARALTQGQLLRSRVQGDSMWALPGPVFSETLPGRTEAMRVEKSALRMVQMPGYSSSGLSISSGLDTAWSIPQRISILPIGEQTGLVTAFEDEKGETVILSAERKEGYGGQDLYVLFREKDGTWSKPKNLGPDLNTYEEEFAPWLSEDGKTLYFTSGGHPGYGGWDLYRSERITQTWTKWSEPENLGPAINTAGDEGWYYPFKDDRAYLASTDSLRGHFDLYGLRLPVDPASLPVVRLSGHIRNKKTGEILGGDLLLRAIKGDTLRKLVEAPDGYFHSLVKYGRGYQMYGIVPGYFPITDTLDLRAVDRFRELSKDVFVAPVEVGEVIRLDKVYFARAEAALLRESFEELDRLVALMKAIPSLEIEIHGHTDNLGELGELQILSELRAERVMGYLVDHGIAATRMVARGFGGSLPVADNRNPDTRPLNRRVEFVIIRR